MRTVLFCVVVNCLASVLPAAMPAEGAVLGDFPPGGYAWMKAQKLFQRQRELHLQLGRESSGHRLLNPGHVFYQPAYNPGRDDMYPDSNTWYQHIVTIPAPSMFQMPDGVKTMYVQDDVGGIFWYYYHPEDALDSILLSDGTIIIQPDSSYIQGIVLDSAMWMLLLGNCIDSIWTTSPTADSTAYLGTHLLRPEVYVYVCLDINVRETYFTDTLLALIPDTALIPQEGAFYVPKFASYGGCVNATMADSNHAHFPYPEDSCGQNNKAMWESPGFCELKSVVAIVDSFFALDIACMCNLHPASDLDGLGYEFGHGTSVASVAAAFNIPQYAYGKLTDPDQAAWPGMAGTFPGAHLLCVEYKQPGMGEAISGSMRLLEVVDSLHYMECPGRVDVWNASWGFVDMHPAVQATTYQLALCHGVGCISSIGNNRSFEPWLPPAGYFSSPASFPITLSAGGVNPLGEAWSGQNSRADVVLKAESVFVAVGLAEGRPLFDREDGTSYSSPNLAGLVGAVKAAGQGRFGAFTASEIVLENCRDGGPNDTLMGMGIPNSDSAYMDAGLYQFGNAGIGDANLDGRVNLDDFYWTKQFLWEGGSIHEENADVSGDGAVDVDDVRHWIHWQLFNGPPPVGMDPMGPMSAEDGTSRELQETRMSAAPKRLVALNQNYPNPFNPVTTISFNAVKPCDYTLTIYNMRGRQLTRFSGTAEPGQVQVEWNACGCASGIYLYKVEAGGNTESKKMLLLK